MTEGVELSPGYVEPVAELVDEIYAIACHLRARCSRYERLLLEIHAGEYGAFTHQMRVAISEAINESRAEA